MFFPSSQNEFRVSMEMALGRITFPGVPGHQGLLHYNPYLVSVTPTYIECSRITTVVGIPSPVSGIRSLGEEGGNSAGHLDSGSLSCEFSGNLEEPTGVLLKS